MNYVVLSFVWFKLRKALLFSSIQFDSILNPTIEYPSHLSLIFLNSCSLPSFYPFEVKKGSLFFFSLGIKKGVNSNNDMVRHRIINMLIVFNSNDMRVSFTSVLLNVCVCASIEPWLLLISFAAFFLFFFLLRNLPEYLCHWIH